MTKPNERKDPMRTLNRHGPRAAIALVVIASAMTIGSGGASSKPRPTSRNEAVLAFKRCLRAHGVPMHHGSGITPSSPAFKSARACAKLLPGFARAKAQMLKVAKCMRQHGIPGFPDPTLWVPSNSNRARVVARAGVVLAIPSSINLRSPSFKHAAAVCGFPPDDWYPVQSGSPFAGTEHGHAS
jgi:hypothetical protein